ncbi:MAG: YkoF family thiamine/hydroxymethylpyrimidine-binding protein [Flavobacteriaceae bacterium]
MKISAELTLTPLKEDFETPIKAFIKALRTSGFTVLENPLSTQIYGDYDALMGFLTQEIKTVFEQEKSVVMTIKLIKGDRSSYVPRF